MKKQSHRFWLSMLLTSTTLLGSLSGVAFSACDFGCDLMKCFNHDNNPNYTEPCFGASDWNCKMGGVWAPFIWLDTCVTHPTDKVNVYACDMCIPDCPTRDPSSADDNSCMVGTQNCSLIGEFSRHYCDDE